ncbi:large ribosomal subunit protein uL24m [Magallana gigas]|uniref:large ribosomal subunit protein uL24m n=1 Tax=Magallana gigas TaxID=29159 RepID=UPI003341A5ED
MRLTLSLLRRTDYWDRFVHRLVRRSIGQPKYRLLKGWKEWEKDWFFTKYGPTNPLELRINSLYFGRNRPQKLIVPYYEPYIFEKDQVMCMVGKDKGKIGTVAVVYRDANEVVLENLNVTYEMIKTNDGEQAISRQVPLKIPDEVKLVDPADKRATDIIWRYLEDGSRVRVSKHTGRVIPIPINEEQKTEGDEIAINSYVASKTKDTDKKEVNRVTFVPKLKSFEQDIMDQMGIEENRQYRKTFWY